MSPQNWAFATFFIPIASAIAYGVWLVVSGADLAHSIHAEKAVRVGTLAVLAVVFAAIPRAWARAIAVASAAALILMMGVLALDTVRLR